MTPAVVMLPMSPELLNDVNHNFPSDPTAIPYGWKLLVDMAYSVNAPLVVMRPILLAAVSVNQSAPSGPVTIDCGLLPGVGTGYSVTTPAVVMRPILPINTSVNHNAPSGPAVIP